MGKGRELTYIAMAVFLVTIPNICIDISEVITCWGLNSVVVLCGTYWKTRQSVGGLYSFHCYKW